MNTAFKVLAKNLVLQKTYYLQNNCNSLTGRRPQQSKKSLIRVHEVENLSPTSWGIKLTEINGPTVHATVMSAADAIVGEYALYVETRTRQEVSHEELFYRTKHSAKMYMLFNSWCKGAKYTLNVCHNYLHV